MKEVFFDPAMQAHKERMQQVYRWQRRRALLKKYRVLIASGAASISMVAALFVWKIFPLF